MQSIFPCFSVGKTLSGRVVYSFSRFEDIADWFDSLFAQFDRDDLFCTYAIFEYLASRARRRHEDDSLFIAHSFFIFSSGLMDDIEGLKAKHHVVTSIDICRLGKSLVNVEFSDF